LTLLHFNLRFGILVYFDPNNYSFNGFKLTFFSFVFNFLVRIYRNSNFLFVLLMKSYLPKVFVSNLIGKILVQIMAVTTKLIEFTLLNFYSL